MLAYFWFCSWSSVIVRRICPTEDSEGWDTWNRAKLPRCPSQSQPRSPISQVAPRHVNEPNQQDYNLYHWLGSGAKYMPIISSHGVLRWFVIQHSCGNWLGTVSNTSSSLTLSNIRLIYWRECGSIGSLQTLFPLYLELSPVFLSLVLYLSQFLSLLYLLFSSWLKSLSLHPRVSKVSLQHIHVTLYQSTF